jgi:hypothetical protein
MYFDPVNGNLLDIVPGLDTSISKIELYARKGLIPDSKTGVIPGVKKQTYDVSNGVPVTEASLNQVDSVSPPNAFIANSVVNSPGEKTTILYVAWSRNTYIHAMDLSRNLSVISAYFPDNNPSLTVTDFGWETAPNAFTKSKIDSHSIAGLETNSNAVADASDGLYMKVQYYDPSRTAIQICKDTYFDSSLNGKLLLKNDSSLNVYDRPSGSVIPSFQTFDACSNIPKQQSGMQESTFAPMIIIHPNKKFLIYYVAHYLNTAIIVLAKSTEGTLYIHTSMVV